MNITKTIYENIYNQQGKIIDTRPKEVLDKVLVRYELEIQGRVTDVKTSFGKFQTVKKEPAIIEYPEGQGLPGSDRTIEGEWEEKLYDQLAEWVEKTLAN